MNCKKYFLFIFLIIIYGTFIQCAYVFGVGIGQYSNEKEILFQPGIEKTYKFYLFDNAKIHASLEGDLAKYATINDPNPDGPQRNIEVTIKFPDYLEPGVHTLYLVATQATENTAAMGGIASVRTGLRVFSLYPFKHPILNGVAANDLNINEKTTIGLSVTNYGEEAIMGASGIITVYDEYNNTIAILNTDTKSISPYETQTLNSVLDAALYNLSSGTYTAVGNVTYDDANINYTASGKFMVGELNINIVDATKELIVNATNKYYITLESDWAGDINNVYAKITTPKGEIIKTPNLDLVKPGAGRKAAGQLEAYIETKGLDIGPHDFDITVYYEGLTYSKTVTVNIIDGVPPKIEKPNIISNNTAVMILGALIVLSVLTYFLVFNKSFNSKNNNGRSEKNNNNDSDAKSFNPSNTGRNENNNNAVLDSEIRPPTL